MNCKAKWPTMELCIAAICLKTASDIRCFGFSLSFESMWLSHWRDSASGRTDELPFQEHGTGGSLYPADKVSIASDGLFPWLTSSIEHQ
jgi:hypothetical protein